MSRSGYNDDCSGAELNMWRGAVNRAINGKRGQAFLRETLAALNAMPDKRLTTNSLHDQTAGEFCTLGAVGVARGMNLRPLEDAERDDVARSFGIAEALAAEIMHENDDGCGDSYWLRQGGAPLESTEAIDRKRWAAMRAWVSKHIIPDPALGGAKS